MLESTTGVPYLPLAARGLFKKSILVVSAMSRVIESVMFFKHYWQVRCNENVILHRPGMFSNEISHSVWSVPGNVEPRKHWVVLLPLMARAETHENDYGPLHLLSKGQIGFWLYVDCSSGPAHITVRRKRYLRVYFQNEFFPAFGNDANITTISRLETVTLCRLCFSHLQFSPSTYQWYIAISSATYFYLGDLIASSKKNFSIILFCRRFIPSYNFIVLL